MTPIETYILQTKETRQKHLKLNEPCIERGGFSTYCKGLMAHVLNTTIPSGRKVHVCHACHNSKCSNPNHLYWGTPSENRDDAISQGKSISPYHANVQKVGLEEANRQQSRPGNKNGKGQKGTTKSLEHRAKIAESIRLRHAVGGYKDVELGRKKKLTEKVNLSINNE